MRLLVSCVFLLLAISPVFGNHFGHPCLPYRERFKLHFRCEEKSDNRDEEADIEAELRGEPTEFARTGFYDRLFLQQNRIAYQGQYAYYPTYGYNANLPENKPFGPYRYSNFFNNKNV